jgi:hypothetical protein
VRMPKKVAHPTVMVAMAPNMLAAAFDLHPKHVYAAIAAGHLETRQLPGTIARRIWVGDAEKWFREVWTKTPARNTRRKSPHG